MLVRGRRRAQLLARRPPPPPLRAAGRPVLGGAPARGLPGAVVGGAADRAHRAAAGRRYLVGGSLPGIPRPSAGRARLLLLRRRACVHAASARPTRGHAAGLAGVAALGRDHSALRPQSCRLALLGLGRRRRVLGHECASPSHRLEVLEVGDVLGHCRWHRLQLCARVQRARQRPGALHHRNRGRCGRRLADRHPRRAVRHGLAALEHDVQHRGGGDHRADREPGLRHAGHQRQVCRACADLFCKRRIFNAVRHHDEHVDQGSGTVRVSRLRALRHAVAASDVIYDTLLMLPSLRNARLRRKSH
mmetsp:Transcript_51602/g.138499  ORF Transcript_51602/g.138499 Transcript_51602/m.138499 type:complete len:304 (+) Transcript_51602:1133-2044(+)